MGPEILFLLWPLPLACIAWLLFQLPRRRRLAALVAVSAVLIAGWFLLPYGERAIPFLALGFLIVIGTVLFWLFVLFFRPSSPEQDRPPG